MPQGKKRIDPHLVAQLDSRAAGESPAPVEAIIQLRPETAAEVAPGPERTEQIASAVLQRITKKLGLGPADVHVFPNLGSFVVSASRKYLRELLDQPEVQGALANRPGTATPIAPSTPARPGRKPRRP